MKQETITIENTIYAASHIEETGYLIKAEDMLLQEIRDKSIVCKGYINDFSEISRILVAFARRISDGADFHILLDKKMIFKKAIKNSIETLNIEERVHFISLTEEDEKQCAECIELPSIALGNLYFDKKREFVKNDIADIYTKFIETGL
ncbi:hypothetical protein H8S37_12885 [Mediterraneibacter sp. NSJ-55]|uniref:Uncharacterized protein n=1 Tax=Mediterraneibacter hominis TaxID=2763054 RepID=A0A923LJ59_9FIRM|nr:hypothetical protein [Mediterraneibacter hominis]MBC5689812.1 hypothetical protein [Mediterraneibacter hominis]